VRATIENLAGSTGVAEYFHILHKYGVDRPKRFQIMEPARLCAQDVYVLVEELRANVLEKVLDAQPEVVSAAVVVEPAGQVGVKYDDRASETSIKRLHLVRMKIRFRRVPPQGYGGTLINRRRTT